MSRNSIKHRRLELAPAGADGSAVATGVIRTGNAIVRAIAIDYISQPATTDILIKRDNTDGVTLFTVTSANTDIVPTPVSMTAGVDETGAALAATDASAGGWPVAGGLFVDVAQGDGQTTGDERVIVDVWFEECEYKSITMQTVGADGSAVATRLIKMAKAGVIRAIRVDYQNEPVSTDIVITADVLESDFSLGNIIFTRTSSATDILLSPVGAAGLNESNAALAATDASDGGWVFQSNFYIDIAQADGYAGGGNEQVVFEFWIDT